MKCEICVRVIYSSLFYIYVMQLVMSDQDGSSDALHSSSKPVRVVLSDTDLDNITAAELATRWRQQDSYVTSLEQRLAHQEGRYSIH